jgi:hypothetical protein
MWDSFVSRTIPHSGGCNIPQLAAELGSRACPGVHTRDFLQPQRILKTLIRNKYSSYSTNIGTAIDIDDEQRYIMYERYCDVRIESILLEVNKKEVTESLW